MAQDEIINLLKECKDEALSVREIAERLVGKVNIKTIQNAVKQLQKYGEIKAIKIDFRIARKIYGKKVAKSTSLFYVVE